MSTEKAFSGMSLSPPSEEAISSTRALVLQRLPKDALHNLMLETQHKVDSIFAQGQFRLN